MPPPQGMILQGGHQLHAPEDAADAVQGVLIQAADQPAVACGIVLLPGALQEAAALPDFLQGAGIQIPAGQAGELSIDALQHLLLK